MAIDKFIPEVWAARLTRILEPKLVVTQFVNHDYEGEIKDAGDTVHIRNFSTAGSVRDYVRNTAMAAPDRASDGEQLLLVDQAKAFYIAVDDIDDVQSDVTIMDKFLERTGRAMADAVDKYAANKYIAGALAGNVIGTVAAPQVVSNTSGAGVFSPYQFCVEARRRLAKQSVELSDLWMVINADLEALFLNDPSFITGGGGIGDANVVRNGQLGRIAGFDIVRTEAVPSATRSVDITGSDLAEETGDHATVLFGAGTYAHTWADQVIKVEAERLQGQFGDAVKGLHVFGSKVIENASYGVAHVDPA
jgi:N4-gp56 family major capsid protein